MYFRRGELWENEEWNWLGEGRGGRTYILIVERYFYAGAGMPLPAGISDIE
jgi:hypothetical protein